MHLVTLATAEGQAAQRTTLTDGQRQILAQLELPRFFDFTPTRDRALARRNRARQREPAHPARARSNTTPRGSFHISAGHPTNDRLRVPHICGSPGWGADPHGRPSSTWPPGSVRRWTTAPSVRILRRRWRCFRGCAGA